MPADTPSDLGQQFLAYLQLGQMRDWSTTAIGDALCMASGGYIRMVRTGRKKISAGRLKRYIRICMVDYDYPPAIVVLDPASDSEWIALVHQEDS